MVALGFPSALAPASGLLGAVERVDPRGHAIHLCVALMWAWLQSVTKAGEGISWGLLVAVTILRLPKIWTCYAWLWRDPLWWTMVAWFAWSWLTCLWGPDARPAVVSGIPDRWLFTPLLLWPVMGRPWLLLGAMAAGGVVHAAVALALSWTGLGWGTYGSFRGLSHLATMQWQFLGSFAVLGTGLRWLQGPMRIAAGTGWIATGLCVWLMAFRNGLVAAIGASIISLVRPPRRRRLSLGVTASLIVGGALVAGWAVTQAPAWQRFEDGVAAAEAAVDEGDLAARMATGGRSLLLQAALDIGLEHPWLGGGAGCFAVEYPQWLLARICRDGIRMEPFGSDLSGSIIHVHSTLVHEWVDGGIPSALLLAAFIAGLGWRLWRQSRTSALAGAALSLYTLVLLHVPLGIITLKAPGALMAICLALSWLGPWDGRAGCRSG